MPHQSSFKPWSPPKILPRDAMVSSLIDQEQHRWNHDLVDQIFMPFEEEQIKNIPLRRSRQEDRVVWHGTKDGCFFVKSAYNQILLEQRQQHSSGVSNFDGVWSRLWRLKIPPKIKHFLWRGIKDTLPVQFNLLRRGIQVCKSCPNCGSWESSMHALISCQGPRELWQQTNISFASNVEYLTSLIILILHDWEEQKIKKFTAISWSIWKACCSRMFEDKVTPPTTQIHNGLLLLDDYEKENGGREIRRQEATSLK
ncbi:Ribonuclease H [Quillaja saponaria]|uniref:Ribonuclease H n=1 Tax=Quillaja saponaria TaxID=32244 RepID=A0AAD7LWR0_QUISA|nr:Ribonuclease H [Quillaja saponaria]